MSDGAYRPEPPSPDEELARLAAEGQRRILDAQAKETGARRPPDEKQRETYLRIALGGHYYSPLLRAVAFVLIVLGAASPVAASALDIDGLDRGAPALLVGVLLLLWVPRATRARVGAEEAWVRALPFPMTGYFEVLGDAPALGANLIVSIVWREAHTAPGEGTLRGLLGLVDAGARVLSCDATSARIRSGSISGRTGIRSPSRFIHRNTRLVGYVHQLVEAVLLPLDRGGRLERVSMSRE